MTATDTDFNVLEIEALTAIDCGDVQRAIAIYTWMADGDPSLDGGYLGERLGVCYERLDQPFVSRFWYRRAVEENPEVRSGANEALQRLGSLDVAELLKVKP